jgi:hypothetical protein
MQLIDRLDGVKMIALALMAAAAAVLVRRGCLLPPWLGLTGGVLAVALLTSATGYLLLDGAPASAVMVSGPLLLLFVGSTGVVLGRGSAPAPPSASPSSSSHAARVQSVSLADHAQEAPS